MAEKKRRGRRAYLSDFQPQLDGKYVYTGALHYYEGADRKRSMALLWGLTAALAVGALVPGLVRAAGMDNHFYVILPWAAELMAARAERPARDGVRLEEKTIPGFGEGERVSVRVCRPETGPERLPVLVYFHGGGCIIGAAE